MTMNKETVYDEKINPLMSDIDTERAVEEAQYWLSMAKDFEYRLTRAEKELEIVARERDAYKAYIDRIVQLKADALLTEPLPPIIVPRTGPQPGAAEEERGV